MQDLRGIATGHPKHPKELTNPLQIKTKQGKVVRKMRLINLLIKKTELHRNWMLEQIIKLKMIHVKSLIRDYSAGQFLITMSKVMSKQVTINWMMIIVVKQ